MTKLSINLNKFALVRNAREQDTPNLCTIAKQCIDYGAHGITVHPRPDERHVKFSDLPLLKECCQNHPGIEFNIEGYPSPHFMQFMQHIQPDQVTLVPDPPEARTSSFGWDLKTHCQFLTELRHQLNELGIRCSLFIDPTTDQLHHLHTIQPNRVELYTFDYNHRYHHNQQTAIKPYQQVVQWIIQNTSIGINAGHDLNLDNLHFLLTQLPQIKEVSIGHALVCDCFQYGLETTIKKYLGQIP